MWFFGLSQNIFPDPLVAGRLVGILSGWFTLIGIYRLANFHFGRKTATISAFLYLFVPIFVFYDRQALMESAISGIGIWSCYFFSRFYQKPVAKWSILLGLTLGFGYLIKANALIFFVATCIIFPYFVWKNKINRYNLLSQFLIIISSFLLIISPVLFQPRFWQTAGDIFYFSLTPTEVIRFPVFRWIENLIAHLDIAFWQLTPPLIVAVILGRKKVLPLTAWTIITLTLVTLVVRDHVPRYLVSYLPPLLIFAGNWLANKPILIPMFILPGFIFSLILITSPPRYFQLLSKFTDYSQIGGYLTTRNTGYQANATIDFIFNDLPKTRIYIGVAANAGNPEQAIFSYLRHRPNTAIGYLDDHVINMDLSEFDCLSASVPVFFVARHDEQGGLNRFYSLYDTVSNKYNSDYNNIYTLKSSCSGKTLNIDYVINYYSFMR